MNQTGAQTGARFPEGLQIPAPWSTWWFRLEPLGPEHNERDHAAWMSSIDHIRRTAGFAAGDWADDTWPSDMSAAANLVDLERHASEFRQGLAFAYTVISTNTDEIIGCVYINPDETGAAEAKVRCWLRVSRASDDAMFASSISGWLKKEWPFTSARFPGRPRLSF